MWAQSPELSLMPAMVPGKRAMRPVDQPVADAHLRHRRDVVQVDAQARIGHGVDHFGEAAEQPLVADPLVIERRQHEHAGAARTHRMGA